MPIMHFDCFIQIIPSILLCFRLISLLKMHFLFVFGKQIYYNYLAVIFYLYGDISAASEYNKKRFILAERKKMLTFCSNSVNILEQ